MGTRRRFWMWVGAGSLLLLSLGVWVYRASLKEQNKPSSSLGPAPRAISFSPADPRDQNPLDPSKRTGMDPHLQETLRTINEINRINEMNRQLKQRAPAPPPSPFPKTPPPSTPNPPSQKEP